MLARIEVFVSLCIFYVSLHARNNDFTNLTSFVFENILFYLIEKVILLLTLKVDWDATKESLLIGLVFCDCLKVLYFNKFGLI